MTIYESFLERLRQLQTKCGPGDFYFLFSLIADFTEIGKLLPQLDNQFLPDAVLNYVITEVSINAAISGSYQRLMLEDIGFTEPVNENQHRLWKIALGLKTVSDRFQYPTLTTRAVSALVCAGALKRAPVSAAWRSLARATLDVPALGLLARGIDVSAMCRGHARENFAEMFRSSELEVVNLTLPEHLQIEVGGELVRGINAGFTAEALQNCRLKLDLILSFLMNTEGPNWSLGAFQAIALEISLTAIARELVSNRLERLSTSSSPLREAIERRQIQLTESINSFYMLRRGLIRRTRYLIILPQFAYLSRTVNSDDLNAWQTDPLRFLKGHIGDIPHSVAVDNVRLRLERVRFLQIDLEAQRFALNVVNHATAEGLALVACRTVGLPNEASIFLAPIIEPLIQKLNIWR